MQTDNRERSYKVAHVQILRQISVVKKWQDNESWPQKNHIK